jgi:hypothetical protein
VHARCVEAVVEFWNREELKRDWRSTAITGQERECGGQTTAGADAVDRDAVRVDAKLGGVLGGPHQPGLHVIEAAREQCLGSQAVFHRHHDNVEFAGQPDIYELVKLDVAKDAPAPRIIPAQNLFPVSSRSLSNLSAPETVHRTASLVW